MGEQLRIHRSDPDEYSAEYRTTAKQADELADKDAQRQGKQATEEAADLDEQTRDLLDEIDTVLEENAFEFVEGYIQKGGE